MMKNKINILGIIAFAAIGVLITFWACEKTDDPKTDLLDSAQDEVTITSMSNEIDAEIDQAINDLYSSMQKAGTDSACKTVAKEKKVVYPVTVVITYNASGCTGRGFRAKTGQIKVVLSDYPWRKNAKRDISFNSFTLNGNKVEGLRTVTYNGLINGKPNWSIVLSNFKVTYSDTSHFTRSANHVRIMEAGFILDTIDINGVKILYPVFDGKNDDVFTVVGTASGVNRRMLKYTENIVDSLHFSQGCKQIKKGSVEYMIEGKTPVTVTYSNDNCSGKIKIESGGKSREVNVNSLE